MNTGGLEGTGYPEIHVSGSVRLLGGEQIGKWGEGKEVSSRLWQLRQNRSGLEGAINLRGTERWNSMGFQARGSGIGRKGVAGLQVAILVWLPGRWSSNRGPGLGCEAKVKSEGHSREMSIPRVRGLDCSCANGAGRFMAP